MIIIWINLKLYGKKSKFCAFLKLGPILKKFAKPFRSGFVRYFAIFENFVVKIEIRLSTYPILLLSHERTSPLTAAKVMALMIIVFTITDLLQVRNSILKGKF